MSSTLQTGYYVIGYSFETIYNANSKYICTLINDALCICTSKFYVFGIHILNCNNSNCKHCSQLLSKGKPLVSDHLFYGYIPNFKFTKKNYIWIFKKNSSSFFFAVQGSNRSSWILPYKSKRPNTKYTYIGEKQCRSSNAKIPRTVAPPTAPPPCLKMATTRRSITSHDWSIKCIW